MTIRHTVALLAFVAGVARSAPALAHCDTTRGPVVTAARAALDAGDPNLVLQWVRAEDEPSIVATFRHTMQVRALGPEARALADRYFFETLVRIHRAGEGAPYTGLADGDPEPIIAATDLALERGSAAEVEQQLVGAVKAGLAERFGPARTARDFRPGDVAAGRAFVATYVPLTHWVEGVFSAAGGTAEHHGAAGEHGGTGGHAAPGEHAAAAPPGEHGSGGHSGPVASGPSHARAELQYLPWILSGLLALAALVEGVFLAKRRRHASA